MMLDVTQEMGLKGNLARQEMESHESRCKV